MLAQSRAVADSEGIRDDLSSRDADYADRWLDELDGLFKKLAEFPNRFALAPEAARSKYSVRHVMVGSYRVLYVVSGETVRILRIRHAAQQPLKPGELE